MEKSNEAYLRYYNALVVELMKESKEWLAQKFATEIVTNELRKDIEADLIPKYEERRAELDRLRDLLITLKTERLDQITNKSFELQSELRAAPQKSRKELARKAVEIRHQKDPKQQEKIFIKGCWRDWAEKPSRYPDLASFARDMLTKCEHLKSQRKIENWVREWKKEAAT